MRPATWIVTALLVSLLVGCASSGRTTTGGDRNVLTDQELAASNQGNLYDAVRALRPTWLNRPATTSRSGTGSTGVILYVDNQRMGELEMMRRMSINSAASVRWLSPSEAQSKFGLDNARGVIQVISPGRPR